MLFPQYSRKTKNSFISYLVLLNVINDSYLI